MDDVKDGNGGMKDGRAVGLCGGWKDVRGGWWRKIFGPN
jgi:hypothetical protein